MNEELKNQLAELVRKSISAAEKTGQFIIDQAPELLREFYAWQLVKASITILIALVVLWIAYKVPGIWLSKVKEEPQPEDRERPRHLYHYPSYEPQKKFFKLYGRDDAIVAWAVFGMVAFITGGTIIKSILVILQIVIAPKMYIIEYFLNK